MFLKKRFYTLHDIKKQLTVIPPIFILLLAILVFFVSFIILNYRLDNELALTKQKDNFYKREVLSSYISDVKYNANSVFDKVENDLRKNVSTVQGFIQAFALQKNMTFKDIKPFLKKLEEKNSVRFILFNTKNYELFYGKEAVEYLQNISHSKLKTKQSQYHILRNIHTLGNENLQYWIDSKRRSIRLSYFESFESKDWHLGVFSRIDDIKVETKRAIFESILIKSKAIDGHFWFYDYLNNIVFNYYNKARAYDLEDILKDNEEDEKILNLYYNHPDLINNSVENIYNFSKYHFLVTVKTNSLDKKKQEVEREFDNQFITIILTILIVTFVIIFSLITFTRFITTIFTRYNKRLEMKNIMFKRWKERYELAIIASNDGLWDINFKDEKIFFSSKWLEMFGYEKNEIETFEDWVALIHEDDRKNVQQNFNRHIRGESEHFIAEYRLRSKSNNYKWVLVRGKVFRDNKNRPQRMLMMSMDIDNNKQISKELRDVELLVDVGRIVIFKWENNEDFNVDYVSKSVTSYGFSKEQFEEQHIKYMEFVHEDDREKLKGVIESAIVKNLSSFSTTYRVIESKGAVRWVYNRTILLKDHFGNVTHLYGYINDITQMKINEEELKLRVQMEVQKNIEKDRILIHQNKLASMGEMLGSIAHQWRQPLNNISLLIHFIRDNFRNDRFTQDDVNENINAIKIQINYMSQTIDDFRNFYQPTKDKNLFVLKESIETAAKIVTTQYEKEDILLTIAGDEIELFSYENELQQVIVNILNNAKDAAIEKRKTESFTPKVNVSIRKVNNNAIIDISNNCGTVSNQVLSRMFEPYFTTKFENQGTGIGLYMSKTIIEKNMNGRIGAKIIENGLNFSIILPI
jgi:PAS domain S-box-containing protein